MEGSFGVWCNNCNRVTTGTIVFCYKPTDYLDPPNIEPFLEIEELSAVADYIQKQFPKGWDVKGGKLIGR